MWVIDPIDGTRNYAAGIPVFAALIALTRHGETLAGVVSAPAFGSRWWARLGGGAYENGRPVRVRPCGSLVDAVVGLGEPRKYVTDAPLRAEIDTVVQQAAGVRAFGDFWIHALVASAASISRSTRGSPSGTWHPQGDPCRGRRRRGLVS